MIVDKSVGYCASWYPHHIGPDLDEIKAAGCTSITLTVNETDWRVFARARKAAIEMAHDRGLKAYIDIHGFGIFPSAQRGSEYLTKHSEKRQIYSNGRVAAAACPNDAEYMAWLKLNTYEMIESFAPDGTFWDEPCFQSASEYPEVWSCRCKNCRYLFQDEYHIEMPNRLTDEVLQFRQNTLIRFVSELVKNSKKAGSPLDFLCLMPWNRSPGRGKLAHASYGIMDWEPFAQIPGLDVFATDPYWIHNGDWAYFVDNAAEAIRIARKHGRKSQIWVQVLWIPNEKEPDISRTVEKVAELGADMIAAWSFKGEAGAEAFSAENPELAWQTLAEAFRRL